MVTLPIYSCHSYSIIKSFQKIYVPIYLIVVSLAVWQRVTVMKGQTLILRCPLTNAHNTYVEWKNPKGYIMFFSHNRGDNHIDNSLKDKRYTIIRLSSSTFTISISNVNFKDGGNYTCSHYGTRTEEKKVEVTVLGECYVPATYSFAHCSYADTVYLSLHYFIQLM
uniref:cytotoxic and regulatory T-cell molecule-like n=1 Tax=Monopterus albus TaxID=43700 RepID=UPI0009B355DC|nr:cytotoxic and regulatory T-cell molecule-like [Monopterus albus]